MSTQRRVAKNTAILYVRLMLTIGVSLYAVRLVLDELGVSDYGIYAVVGGIVALFSFLPSAMASATQRYFSFAIGESDDVKLKSIFTVNWVLYAAIAVVAFVVLDFGGMWYIEEHLRYPVERQDAVIALYRYSVFAFMAGIITSPFMAITIAHEDMHIFAGVSILEALLKLAAALALGWLPGDSLEVYGLLVLLVSLVTAAAYVLICCARYPECQFRRFYWNLALLREILGFTGWTLFGQLTTVIRNHAVTILLNQSFGPAVVAARAIALQVGTQTSTFAQGFNTSLYPPIVKSYAAGNSTEMFSLVFVGSRITFFLMWLMALPLFLEMDTVLSVWLKNPPADAVLFARLALLEALITSVSLPLMTAARASGRMRGYELTLGAMQISILPLSWLALQFWHEPWMVFGVAIGMNVAMFFARLLIVKGLVGLPVGEFMHRVMLSIGAVAAVSCSASFATAYALPDGVIYAGINVLMAVSVAACCIYFWGLDVEWRRKLHGLVASKMNAMRRST